MESFPIGRDVPRMEGRGGAGGDEAGVSFFMDDAISVKAQLEGGGGCLDLSKSLASILFQASGEMGTAVVA